VTSPDTPAVSKHDRLVDLANDTPPAPTAIVHPCDESSIAGALAARDAELIIPVFVGPAEKITAAAAKAGLDISGITVIDAPHSHAAAARGVELVREGKVEMLMKGSLHTDELMAAVLDSATGLRTGRRVSHVFIMDVPGHPETLFITDAAINIFPDLTSSRTR
jgi:phosphate acetyltransferase